MIDFFQNGAECSLSAAGPPTCICPIGFSGVFCEVPPSIGLAAYQQVEKVIWVKNLSKILKQASPCSQIPLHRPPHAWLTPADMVLALPPPQLHTSASANQDFQARGKITNTGHTSTFIFNLTFSFTNFPQRSIKATHQVSSYFDFPLKRCEYLTTVQLAGSKPYIQLDPLFTTKPLNLTMVLKTRANSGVLLYYGDSDHLAVELFHGRVRVRENFPRPL